MKATGDTTSTSATVAGTVGLPLWKRALDLGFILAISPVLVPLMLAIAGFIKLVSPGPVLFKQLRIGYLDKSFTCFKFRTMAVDADARLHKGHLDVLMGSNLPMKKLDSSGDPRLIPGAVLLRSLGIDELPQIFNVLRGEMSLVGPRPCVLYEYEKYNARHRERSSALPGLTGLWQVSGKNRTTFEEMIDFDVYYANHKSLLMDAKIILMTIPALLSQTRDLSDRSKEAFGGRSAEQH